MQVSMATDRRSALKADSQVSKTTNGGHASSFIVSRNELDFSAEAEEAFHLYRVFQFREEPKLYILKGSLADQVHLEPIDYRASFRRLVG